MASIDIETRQRCKNMPSFDREIIAALQQMLREKNHFVCMFEITLEQMPNNEYKIVIGAEKMPSGKHERRFNAPTSNEVIS